jgi:Holliday junction resolvase RusA-like endonuclease
MSAVRIKYDTAPIANEKLGLPLYKLTIPGRCMVLKNNKRIFGGGRGRKKIVLPSRQYTLWEKNAVASVLGQLKSISRNATTPLPINFEVEMRWRFYFANRQGQADLSNLVEGPQDVLQKAGVLKNDKLVRRSLQENYFGYEPRIEVEIYKYLTGETAT